jgi:hypothetical protein
MGALAPLTDVELAEIADVDRFLKRADSGDKSVLPTLRKLLESPESVEMLGGDLAARAQKALVAHICGRSLASREAVLRKLALLREELAGPSPTPIERLIVERIAACWLQLHQFELIYAGRESMSLELATFYQRSIDRAQKRYLSAIKALAQVRRLALPVLQVNVARKQVNVAGSQL